MKHLRGPEGVEDSHPRDTTIHPAVARVSLTADTSGSLKCEDNSSSSPSGTAAQVTPERQGASDLASWSSVSGIGRAGLATMSKFRQAILRKGRRFRVAWIPAQLAVVGRFLRLHNDDGWKVEEVSKPRDGAFIKDRERDYKYQRRVSDV